MSKSTQRRVPQPLAMVRAAAVTAALLASCAAPPTTPGQVGAVTVTAVPAGLVVEWTGGEGATGFVVYRAVAGAELAELATVTGDERRYEDFSVSPDDAYTYAVAAVGPGGPGEPVAQDGEAVAPLPGVRLGVELDGSGTVVVEGPAGTYSCREDCVVGFPPGAEAVLTGADGELVFAGFSDPCPPAPSCRLAVEEDTTVTALFRAHVLRLSLDGDAPAKVRISPPDDRGHESCEVSAVTDCLLGFTYNPGDVLQVSINAAPLDPDGARLLGLGGDCGSSHGFCVAEVLGATHVEVLAAVTPVAVPDTFAVRGDAQDGVEPPGVLANDEVGSSARAELVEFEGPGELVLADDGSFTYKPPKKPPESVTFSYRLRGAHDVAGPPADVTLSVVPAPSPSPDGYGTAEDAELSVPAPGVLANDSFAGEVTIEVTEADAHGEVDLSDDGSFVFRPARDDVRPFEFKYRLRNALGAESREVAVRVTVNPVNDPPTFELAQGTVAATPVQLVEVPGFAYDISPGGGPDEAGQGLEFRVTYSSGDPIPFTNGPSISADGTLRFRGLLPGTVTLQVVLVDKGGKANGGQDTSEPAYFTITLGGP